MECHKSGTHPVEGSVLECALADGRVEIIVDLSTSEALGFAQSIDELSENKFDFDRTRTIFGAKAKDVAKGAEAAVGPARLQTSFVISSGALLPDLVDVFNNAAAYAPVKLKFISTTVGTLPDGSAAHLHVRENAATNNAGNLEYKQEIVQIVGD